MAQILSSQDMEALAADIGDNVYIDVAKWHLYLKEAHLSAPLAERLAPMLAEGRIDEQDVLKILSDMVVPLGGGKQQLPLSDLVPVQCQVDLIDLLEEFQQRL